ncbi:transcriptional regulator MarR family [Methanobrevibacter ruminantium M1]|uniref:Transcriptional regulator MarR family n=1 Tax=Methanobrevibacter ruminantium (strain ATCC 35063 / DSM 1093 / JCM 13430 / OCM 146 / M1) TaxID=634498 RepID=D3E4E5_METRM|nr:winged helix-turn-helix domain-containing protein [Methanobrevibacter ruminantium]ADC47406.1 transcriptional regulator MarR family [Methanobrevibacter ruminantium M1]
MSDFEEVMTEYIKISKHREKVFKTLKDGSKKPSDIARETNLNINSVSLSLKQLTEKELVYLLNPDDKKGRLYKLTEIGETIIKEFDEKTE